MYIYIYIYLRILQHTATHCNTLQHTATQAGRLASEAVQHFFSLRASAPLFFPPKGKFVGRRISKVSPPLQLNYTKISQKSALFSGTLTFELPAKR